MGEHDELLARFAPALRYDANEQFFADSAAQYTHLPGVELRRAPRAGKPGALLASAVPAGQEARLALAFLGPRTYANGAKVEKTDVIGVRGRDYRAQYVALRMSRPDLNNRVYGRAVKTGDGRLWLQYWLFYFYNDYQLALGFGTHEGDWECVQLRMGIDGDAPDVAVYAQHRHGEKRSWEDVEKLAGSDRPVVYVARGSHAAYFDYNETGYHPSMSRTLRIPFFGDYQVPSQFVLETRSAIDWVANGQPQVGNGVAILPERVRLMPHEQLLRDLPALRRDDDWWWLAYRGLWGSPEFLPFFGGSGPRGPRWQGTKWANPFRWVMHDCIADDVPYWREMFAAWDLDEDPIAALLDEA